MAERDQRLQQLRADIAIGLEQIERGELIDFTPELLDDLSREAEENARDGKPIRAIVKAPPRHAEHTPRHAELVEASGSDE